MTNQDCYLCNRIAEIEEDADPFFVAELETGYVVMGPHQFFRGYTLFLCKQCAPELHELPEDFRAKFLAEMSIVAEAVFHAFKPRKMNYELLGNTVPHLHWHLFPRHADDPNPKRPVWEIGRPITESEDARPHPEELNALKRSLLAELEKLAKAAIVRRASCD